MKPKLSILEEDSSKNGLKEGGYVSFYFITSISIMSIVYNADKIIGNATGKISIINHVEDIKNRPLARFYIIKNMYINKNNSSYDSSLVGSKTGDIPIVFTVACPLLHDEMATVGIAPVAWVVYSYEEQIDKEYFREARDRSLREAGASARKRFADTSIDSLLSFKYLERVTHGHEMEGVIHSDMYKDLSNTTINPIVLHPVWSKLKDRSWDSLFWAIISYTGGIVAFLVNLSFSNLKSEESYMS